MRNQPFDCVVFDAVGTLIYPDPPVGEAYAAVGRRFGSARSATEITSRFRAAFRHSEQFDYDGTLETSEERERRRWQQIVAEVLDDVSDTEACFEALFEHFGQPKAWATFADVRPTFEALRSGGIRIVLASNFDARLHNVARGLEPLSHCDTVIISSAVGVRKPHPAFYRAVLDAARCSADRILCVGDSTANDIAPARAAGMQAILIDRRLPAAPGRIATLHEIVSS